MNNRAASGAVSACGMRLFTPPTAGFIICTPLHPRGKPRGIRGQIIKSSGIKPELPLFRDK